MIPTVRLSLFKTLSFISRQVSSLPDVLVVNCGSSSIKCQIVNPESDVETNCTELKITVDRLNTDNPRCILVRKNEKIEESLIRPTYEEAFRIISKHLSNENFGAIGHRVVHGGPYFREATRVTDNVKTKIKECILYAPIHNPKNLEGIEKMEALFSDKPQVVVFDTAFHQTMPEKAFRYAIPEYFYEHGKIRKYGFHGISHKFVVESAIKHIQTWMGRDLPANDVRIVSAHLGNGCSVTASLNGMCLDTSMGLTPLEGLVMGERSGDIDPSALMVFKKKYGLELEESMNILNHESGFKGIFGSPDSIELERAVSQGQKMALLALDIFCYRLAKYIASYVIPLGGLNVLVFTGGIGEKSAIKREKVMEYLKPIGVKMDSLKNEKNGVETKGIISSDDSKILVMVIPTNEELLIAQETVACLTRNGLND